MNLGDITGGAIQVATPVDGGGLKALASSLLVLPTGRLTSAGPDNSILTPVVAPIVAVGYEIYQTKAGNGTTLLFYDCAALPANGAALFGNADDTQNVVWMAPLAPGQLFIYHPHLSGHLYIHGCGIIVSTSDTSVARASTKTSIAVRYFPYNYGV